MARFSIKNRTQAQTSQSLNASRKTTKRQNRSLMHGLRGVQIDQLEVRQLLTTYYVDNFSDDITGTGSNGTLRWAVAQANANAGDDIIQFSSSSLPQTITLTAANGTIIIKDSTGGNLSINGLGQSNLTISGGNVTGLFLVKSPTSISNLTMTNGNGAGTLGGAKSGGAILNISCLTLNQVSISNSSVTSGYGGAIASSYGGTDYPNDLTANVRLVASNLSINDTSVNVWGFGGAIYSGAHNAGTSATLILTDSCISNTYAKTGGGAINHQTGYFGGTANMVVSNLTLTNTTAGTMAGGLLIGSSSNSNVTIDRLQADKSYSTTGGLLRAEMNAGADKTFITISNSTIKNTNATIGGAFSFSGIGNVTIRDTVFSNSSATGNGGLLIIDSNNATVPSVLNISNISVSNTTANYGGGIYAANTISTINRVNITKATASQFGGGIYNTNGNMTVNNATISFGVAGLGGAVHNSAANATSCLTINDSNITDSRGSVCNYASNATAYLYVNRSSVQRGYGYDGGGLLNAQVKGFAITAIDSSYFANSGNSAIENLGAYQGASYYAKLTLSNSIVENNVGENGPVFSNGYTGNAILTISNTTIRNNTVFGDAGAVTVIGHYGKSDATIENSNISNNQANQTGGGIRVFGTSGNVNLFVNNTVIMQNKSNTSGGGIFIEQGAVTVTNSTISKNTANVSGGGIALFNGTLSVSKSTICENMANLGGAIYNAGATAGNSNVYLNSATVANNNATLGGGVYDANSTRGTMNFYNTIVANNTASSSDADVKGIIDISQYSLYSSNVLITSNTSSLLNTNPLLGNLGYNGGFTPTIPILSGSPAIGNANASVYGSMDQRGFVFDTSDIGAFAYNGITDRLLVTSTANSGSGSLREAIAFAATNPGDDTITFFPNLMNGTITLTTPITINDATGSVTINGLGQSNLTISGGNSTGIFNIRSMTTISDVAIRYGRYQTIGALPLGGSIYNDHASLTLNNVTVANSSSEYGGAIYNDGSYGNATLSINNSTLSDNNATYRGGAIYNDGWAGNAMVSINNSTLARNTANSLGGAIFNNGRMSGKTNLLINNSSLANNNAKGNGGALYLDFSNLVMAGSTVTDNKSGGNGGAVTTDGGMATFSSTQFISNTSAANGGALDTGMNNTTVLITDSFFQSNLAPNAGGAIGHGVGSLTISNTTFRYNRATNFGGGAIFSLSGYSMNNSTLAYNNTTGSGGALYLDRNGAVAEANVSISNTTFSYNTANASGGGIYNNAANLILNGGTFANHSAQYGGGIYNRFRFLAESVTLKNSNATNSGGAIYSNSGNVTLANSTISLNKSGDLGGGVCHLGATLNVTGSWLEDNVSVNNGGAISISSQSKVLIADSTFHRNNSSMGGAIDNGSTYSTIDISNSTFSNNTVTIHGGAIGNGIGNLTIANSTFTRNSAPSGGAIMNFTNLVLSGSTLSNNNATNGGGLYSSGAKSILLNSSVVQNTALNYGAGIYAVSSTVDIANSNISENGFKNNAGYYGAGLYASSSTTNISQTLITRNSGCWYGGGVYAASGNTMFANAVISDNSAVYYGGGLYTYSGNSRIENTSIIRNQANSIGGGVYSYFVNLTMLDSEVLNNNATSAPQWLSNNDVVRISGQVNSNPTIGYGTTEFLQGSNLTGNMELIQGGTLSGSINIAGDLKDKGGVLSPGNGTSSGCIRVQGNYDQTSNGAISIRINSLANASYNQIQVQGNTSLAGTMRSAFTNGFIPVLGEKYQVLNSGNITGSFASYRTGYANQTTLDMNLTTTSLNLTAVANSTFTPFTLDSPAGGLLPAGVTMIGGLVLDMIGTNGVRVVSQVSAADLYQGYYNSGTPTAYQGNPGTIGIQTGITANIINALGGGLSQVAVRVTLYDGDTGAGNFDDNQNTLALNGVEIGNFSDVITLQTNSDGTEEISYNQLGGFRDSILDTGFFYSNTTAFLTSFYDTLTTGSVKFTLSDTDPYDNYFDFKQGIAGGLINVGQTPNSSPSSMILSNDTIAENLPSGTVVGLLSTVDADAGNTHTYKLVAGVGDSDNGLFTLVNNELRTNGPLDYEFKSAYTVRIRTTDNGGLWLDKVFIIKLTDINEAPVNVTTGGPYSVYQGQSLTLNATGNDPESGALTYSWDINHDGIYGDVTGKTVTLTWSQLNSLGFVNTGSRSISVIATDGGGLTTTSADSTITVNTTILEALNSGLSTSVGLSFSQPIRFIAKNTQGIAISGVTIDLVAPTTGATCSFAGTTSATTDINGVATSSTVVANQQLGTYTVEAKVAGVSSVSTTLTNSPPQLNTILVQKGSVGRSFVQHVDLAFNTTATLADIVASIGTASPRIRMTNTGLDGSQNVNYNLANKIAAVDAVLAMNFGDQGIGGDRNSAVGDGSYLIELDLDNNGSFETSRRFFRLLGDVNGDKVVDALDANIVAANIGATGSNVAADVNGDGVVNAADTLLVRRQKGRRITI